MSINPGTAPLRTAYVRGTDGLYYKIGEDIAADIDEVHVGSTPPATPFNGQIWVDLTGAGGTGGAASGLDEIHVGDTAPPAPFDGQMWVDTTGEGGGGTGGGSALPAGGTFGDVLVTGAAGATWNKAGVIPGATYVLGIGTTDDGNITLSGPKTLDGASITPGETVLLTAQSNSFQNGLWVCQTGAWTRMPGFDVDGGIRVGQIVAAEGGDNHYKSLWVCNYLNDEVWTMAWQTYSYWEPFGVETGFAPINNAFPTRLWISADATNPAGSVDGDYRIRPA